jgi:hypothetical protein
VPITVSKSRRNLPAMLLLLTGCLLPRDANGQAPAHARIEGVVVDSIHSAPPSGALVLLARRTADTVISRSATTDDRGRFSFTELPPGEYVVALESSLLDSLELALAPASVTLSPGERRQLSLAIPSRAGIGTLLCPGVSLPAGVGAIAGRVADATDATPLPGATLTVSWAETSVDPATLRATNVSQGVDVRTDSLGRFRICGVPTDTYLDVRASLDAYHELLLQVVVPEEVGAARQDLALTRAEHAGGTLAAHEDTSARAAPAATVGTLSGIVYGPTAPLSRVQLQRHDDSVVVTTDSLGRYRMRNVPLGPQVVEVRRVGYMPRQLSVNVRPGENRAMDLHLTPVVALDSIRVVARRTVYREFESRAKIASFGRFLRAEDIDRKRPLLTSDLVRQIPGLVVVRGSTSDLDVGIASTRGITSLTGPTSCFVNIVIDGVPHQGINWIDPYSIGAMEIYTGTSTAPVQYPSPCGTILIWTKRP